jgi:Transglutaminase-like superfamily
MANVPAFREEPRMPPEDSVRPWMLVYYSEDRKLAAEKFWKELGKENFEKNKSRMKVSDEVKQAAATAIGDATDPEKKIERLFEFCRSKIKNVNDDASGLTTEERSKLKENKTPADTLKRGMGTGLDIDMLFAAMAIAAGFDARVVNLADRSDVFFDKSFPDDYFIGAYDIAVRIGDTWRFYDPASTYVPFGMLRWQEEAQEALLSDPKDPVWVKTPLSPPEKSKQRRIAKLRLDADGTLEGDVRIEYHGHMAVDKKELDDDDSPAQREETLRNSVKLRMSTAELTNIGIENVTDPVKPYTYVYRVRVPGYAERTGKRIFLQPAFFQRGLSALFSTSSRTHAVYFSYPWSEEDEVTIELPPGFSLDNADAPAPFGSKPISEYKPSLSITKDGRTLLYKRQFYFGGEGNLLFPVTSYPQLKQYFDALHKQDNHAVVLKQSAAAASN